VGNVSRRCQDMIAGIKKNKHFNSGQEVDVEFNVEKARLSTVVSLTGGMYHKVVGVARTE